jgi:hypothetical protein
MAEHSRRGRGVLYFLCGALLLSVFLNVRLYSARGGVPPSRSIHDPASGPPSERADHSPGEDRAVRSNQKTNRNLTDCSAERARMAQERTDLIKSIPASAPASALFRFGTPNPEGAAKVEADLRRLRLEASESVSVECRGEVCRILVVDVPSAADRTVKEIMASGAFRNGLTAMNLSNPRLATAIGSQGQLVEMPIFVRMRGAR